MAQRQRHCLAHSDPRFDPQHGGSFSKKCGYLIIFSSKPGLESEQGHEDSSVDHSSILSHEYLPRTSGSEASSRLESPGPGWTVEPRRKACVRKVFELFLRKPGLFK